MKYLIVVLLTCVLASSCREVATTNKKMGILLSEYESMDDEWMHENSFQEQLDDLREEALKDKNISVLKSIDSLVKLGMPAPEFKQDKTQSDTINDPKDIGRKCRTIDDAPSEVLRIRANSLRLPASPISIPVSFHVIQSEDGDGFISTETLQNQLKILNDNFSNTLFSFTYEGEDYTKNSDWYSRVDIDNTQEADMHKALSLDPIKNLNVYFVGHIGNTKNSDLGYASFPWDFNDKFDGVVIYNLTVPGGSMNNYNEGKTLTHEVGHYLGLWHTFHNGCKVGDSVIDTPAQAVDTAGCPQGKDTCPNDPGYDPIENYMDYSYDSCMTEFTAGQNSRMNWAVREYRPEFIISDL